MGYRVEYEKKVTFSDVSGIRIGRTLLMTLGIGVLFLTTVYKFWPDGARVMEKIAAFDGLRQIHGCLEMFALELQCGTGFDDALSAFCRDVVALGIRNAA